jgi:predicted RNA binding protein YcfA (HicA-like mRNA interferase family)
MPKKRDLEKELIEAGWTKVKRKSGPHDKFVKPGLRSIAVPRHAEIDEITARVIRKQAGLL